MSYETLYRKYRPQNFEQIVGQKHIKITLQNEIRQDQVAHAFLFTGPRGIGKTTMARILAKSLNCQQRPAGQSEPCNKCSSCQEINQVKSLQIVEIDAASHTGVDNVRENVISNAYVSAGENKFKVFIIDEVHMLSSSAFNALLKIIEEPPKQVIFVLATTEIHKVPETIISRCQRFDFQKIKRELIVDQLQMIAKQEEVEVDRQVLQNVAARSQGYMRDAISILGQIISLGETNITLKEADLIIPRSDFSLIIKLINHLAGKQTAEAIKLINKIVEEGVEINQFAEDLLGFMRKLLVAKTTGSMAEFSVDLTPDNEQEVAELLTKLDLAGMVQMTQIFLEKQQQIKFSPIIQLPLELAVIQIIQALGSKSSERSEDFQKPDQPQSNQLASRPVNKENKAKQEPVKTKQSDDSLKTDKQNQDFKAEGQFNIDKIRQVWDDILKNLEENHHSLYLLLKTAQLEAVKDNKIIVKFQYKLHCDKINSAESSQIICQSIEKLLGQPFLIQAENGAVEPAKPAKNKNNQQIDSLLNTFEGEIV